MKKCETVAELAAATGIDEAALQNTLTKYNGYAASGHDVEFHREIAQDLDNPSSINTDTIKTTDFTLTAIEPPYYCFEMTPIILNTQGGPKRGVGGEVLDVEGNPIPRLYSAGEMGCIYGYKYNLGGNFGEAISSGRLAARSCSKLESLAAPEA